MNANQELKYYNIDSRENSRQNNLSPKDYENIRSCLDCHWKELLEYFRAPAPGMIPERILRDEERENLEKAELIWRVGFRFEPSYRLFRVRDVYVSTDFPTKKHEKRVFPWTDEGELMLDYRVAT